MIGAIITSHGLFAKGVLSSCDMIFGNHKNIEAICLTEGVSAFTRNLDNVLDDMSKKYDSLICFADLKGGTPYNQLMKYKLEKKEDNLKIIVGVNLPMVIEFLSRNDKAELGKVIPYVIDTGKNSIFEESLPQENNKIINDDVLD